MLPSSVTHNRNVHLSTVTIDHLASCASALLVNTLKNKVVFEMCKTGVKSLHDLFSL